MKTIREVKAVVKEMIERDGIFMMQQTAALGYL